MTGENEQGLRAMLDLTRLVSITILSSREFVGVQADNPQEHMELKTFHVEVLNNHTAIAKKEKQYVEIPIVRETDPYEIQDNFIRIKNDLDLIIRSENERIRK